MGLLLNRAKANTSTTGTGSVTPESAVSPYQTWSAAGATSGYSYSYLIEDGAAWEIGVGVYNGTTLTRPGSGTDPQFASSTGSLLNLSGSATIACVANKNDLAAGSPFMPPLSGYFPTALTGSGSNATLTDSATAGLQVSFGTSATGDIQKLWYKAVTAAGDWQVVARINPSFAQQTSQYGGIYVMKSGSNLVLFGFACNTNAAQAIYILKFNSSGSGYVSTPLTDYNNFNMQWLKVTYTSSSTTLTFYFSNDGLSWINAYSATLSTLSLSAAPDRLGIGIGTNVASQSPILSCPYWWDNA